MIIKLGGPRGWRVVAKDGVHSYLADPTPDGNCSAAWDDIAECVISDMQRAYEPGAQLVDKDGIVWDNAADFLERWSR